MPPLAASRKTKPLAPGAPASKRSRGKARSLQGRRDARLQRPPLDAAEAFEHRQQRLAQRALHGGVAVHPHRRPGLAQQQQPRRVVDLRIGQQDAGDRRCAHAVQVRGRQRLELLARVRRRVDEEPRPLLTADRKRRLHARTGAYARSRSLTRVAVAVPLRKPPPAAEPRTRTRTRPGLQTPTGGAGRR